MKTNVSFLSVIGVAVLLSGCVSTPDSRIKKEPQLFASFAPDIQTQVQRGEIQMGFSRDMVRLALGRPARVHIRTDATGESEVWTYVHSRYISHYEPSTAGYWYRDRAGRLNRSYDTMWVDRGWYEDYPVLRLEFVSDKLKAIERVKR